jgi:hypothetical protein
MMLWNKPQVHPARFATLKLAPVGGGHDFLHLLFIPRAQAHPAQLATFKLAPVG